MGRALGFRRIRVHCRRRLLGGAADAKERGNGLDVLRLEGRGKNLLVLTQLGVGEAFILTSDPQLVHEQALRPLDR
jgi:hypothetical protein